MNSLNSSSRTASYLCRIRTLILPLTGAGIFLRSIRLRLSADSADLAPTVHFTQDLVGTQVCLRWSTQPGVQYVVEKSATLASQGSPGGFTRVALVTAEGTTCQWVDPEAATNRGFYRVEIPRSMVFGLEPAVISPTGGDIFVRGQCLPAGSFLVLEIPGQSPVSVPLEPVAGQPGLWRASISSGAVVGIAIGSVIAALVVDTNGVTVALIEQTIAVTETGYASDAPPWLPPAAPVLGKKMMGAPKIGEATAVFHAGGGGDDCDDADELADGDSAVLIAAWLSRKGYQHYMAKSDMAQSKKGYDYYKARSNMASAGMHHNPYFKGNSNEGAMPAARQAGSGMGAGKVNIQDFHFVVSGGLPGEVSAKQCDLALPCPAGPQLAWSRSYRSKAPVSSGHGPGWEFCYNISLEPVPLAAGVNAPVVIVRDGSGRSDKFERQGDGTYRGTGMFREGRFNPDSSFTLTFADKGTWIFCPLVGAPWSGRIGSITDRNGVALSFTYNNGQLATVSDAFGRSLAVTWSPTGQISSVADSTGRTVSYSYYSGETGGSAGDLKSVSCPQVAGQAPVCGPTTFTYTSGFSDARLNHNLTGAQDGAGRNLGSFTYSAATSPVDLEFDAVASIRKGHELSGNVTLIKIGPAPQPPGGFDPSAACVIYENDELGRVTETTCDRMHRPTSIREYTGFATPGTPVTATTNRPTGKLRTTDPDFYQTTFLYNGQHLCTRVTMPDGLQERITYECDINSACPLRERANPRVCTLVSPGGEKRTVSMDYLPGFGSPES